MVADEDNKYNISGFVQYNETLLSDGAIIYCNLTIPDTDYYVEENIEFHSGEYFRFNHFEHENKQSFTVENTTEIFVLLSTFI